MALLNITGQGLVSSGAALESLSVWSFKMRLNRAVLEALPTDFSSRTLLQFQKAVVGSSGDTQRVTVQRNSAGLVRLNYLNNVSGSVSAGYVIDLATLPEYVVIYGQRQHGVSPNGVGCGLFTDAGVVVTLDLIETNGQSPLVTGTGTGALTLNGDSQNLTIDGLAIYSAPLTGANRYTPPTAGDANIVALWQFADGAGSTAANSVAAAPSMVLTGASWLAGGTWPTVAGGSSLRRGVDRALLSPLFAGGLIR